MILVGQSMMGLSDNISISSSNKVFILKLLIQQLLYLLQDSKMQEMTHPSTKTNGRWTKQEHLKFLEGLRIYGKNWKKIEQLVATRTGSQIRSHAQKFFLKEEHDIQLGSDELIEQLEEVTLNSKTVSESGMSQSQFSFYLDKIMKHWFNKQSFDFWTSLVDSQTKNSIPKQTVNNNSFTNYQKGDSQRKQCNSKVIQPSL